MTRALLIRGEVKDPGNQAIEDYCWRIAEILQKQGRGVAILPTTLMTEDFQFVSEEEHKSFLFTNLHPIEFTAALLGGIVNYRTQAPEDLRKQFDKLLKIMAKQLKNPTNLTEENFLGQTNK